MIKLVFFLIIFSLIPLAFAQMDRDTICEELTDENPILVSTDKQQYGDPDDKIIISICMDPETYHKHIEMIIYDSNDSEVESMFDPGFIPGESLESEPYYFTQEISLDSFEKNDQYNITVHASGLVGTAFFIYGDPDIIYPSLKQQLESGVAPEDIMCKDNLVLVVRTNGKLACVTEKTIERTGWELVNINFNINDKLEEFPVESPDESNIESTEETLEEFVIPITDHEMIDKIIPQELPIMINSENYIDRVPKTDYIQYAFTITDWSHDELAQKLSDFTNDEITSQRQTPSGHTNYDTAKGFMQIGTYPSGNSFVDYKLIGQHIIPRNNLKDFTLNLQQELNYPIGNEVLSELNRQHFDIYKYTQQVDNLYVENTGMGVSTDNLNTRIYIKDWYSNLSDVELYDYEKAQQIAIDYALMFDELTGSACKIAPTDDFWKSSMKIVHGTPVYEIYAGTCEVKYALGVPAIYYTNINAITGEPLYFTTEPIL